MSLALHSPGPAARNECVDLRLVETIEVTGHRVLQARRGNSELQSVLGRFATVHGVDEARCKAVSCSHTIDDMRDLVLFAQKESIACVKASRPAIMRGALRFS